MLRAAGNQRIQVALHRTHTNVGKGSKQQHQRNALNIGCHNNQTTAEGCECITPQVDLIHTAHFLDDERRCKQTDDHGDVVGSSEGAQQRCITKHIGHKEDANASETVADMAEHVDASDHQIILVGKEQLGSLTGADFFLGSISHMLMLQFRLGKFLY